MDTKYKQQYMEKLREGYFKADKSEEGQILVEEIPEPIEEAKEKIINPEDALYYIKENGLKLNNLHLLQNPQDKVEWENNLESGAYVENGGVYIANIEGNIFAIPASDKTTNWIYNSGLVVGNAGVPNLNDKKTWGPEASQRETFKEWVELYSEFKN